jgi:hypothetical protein
MVLGTIGTIGEALIGAPEFPESILVLLAIDGAG